MCVCVCAGGRAGGRAGVCMSACVLLNDVVEIVPVCSWPALCSPRHDVPLVSSYSWHKPRDRKSPKSVPKCSQHGNRKERKSSTVNFGYNDLPLGEKKGRYSLYSIGEVSLDPKYTYMYCNMKGERFWARK